MSHKSKSLLGVAILFDEDGDSFGRAIIEFTRSENPYDYGTYIVNGKNYPAEDILREGNSLHCPSEGWIAQL